MAKKKYTFIDLFAGCGDLCCGLMQAGTFQRFVTIDNVSRRRQNAESGIDLLIKIIIEYEQ